MMKMGVYPLVGVAVIVAQCHDGSFRVFGWEVGGDGPDNTWSVLSRIVDRNLGQRGQSALPPDALVCLRGAMIESASSADGPRP